MQWIPFCCELEISAKHSIEGACADCRVQSGLWTFDVFSSENLAPLIDYPHPGSVQDINATSTLASVITNLEPSTKQEYRDHTMLEYQPLNVAWCHSRCLADVEIMRMIVYSLTSWLLSMNVSGCLGVCDAFVAMVAEWIPHISPRFWFLQTIQTHTHLVMQQTGHQFLEVFLLCDKYRGQSPSTDWPYPGGSYCISSVV